MANFFDKGISLIESFVQYVSKHMIGKDMTSYCDLATAVGLTTHDVRRDPDLTEPYILVNSNRSLVSVFDVQGTFQILSDEEFSQVIANLRSSMNGYMNKFGHSISLGFERDQARGFDELMRLAEPQIVAARRIGLDTEDIILDRVKRNAPYVAFEQNLLFVYTHVSSMSPEELKAEIGKRIDDVKRLKHGSAEFGQNPALVLLALKDRHDTMLRRLRDDLENCGLKGQPGFLLRPMLAREAVKRVRIMINRERTSQKFRCVLPGDKFVPHGRPHPGDNSDLVPPLLKYQICANSVRPVKGTELIQTDGLFHGTLSMELGPQESRPFSKLFGSISRETPWRVRFDLSPGGLNEMRGRSMALSFIGLLPANSAIRDSFAYLREASKTEAVMTLKVTFSTWSSSVDETKRRLGELEKAIQAWGTCQVTGEHGDPMKALASTIPGFTIANVANRMPVPLGASLGLMPWQRPATPWADRGNFVQRTPDGKIFPIQLGTSLQDTWIELFAATPGGGKSVTLNSMNSSAIHAPGNVRLPRLTLLDVGPSAEGLVMQVRDSLPPHRSHEAVYLRLQNDIKFGVNPGDTQLGCHFLTTRERDFLVSFYSLFCTDPSSGKAPADVAGVLGMIFDLTYSEKAAAKANVYEKHVDPEVDEAIKTAGLLEKHDEDWWSSATWYEVVDLLFAAGDTRAAARAQRQAVPVAADHLAALHHPSITSMFGSAKTERQEPLLDYMQRAITVAMANYPMFAGRTRFELSAETRIIVIDLNDVLGGKTPEGRLKSALMYMFAFQLAARDYFLHPDLMRSVVRPLYEGYHDKRIADCQDETKIVEMDEFHNTGGLGGIVETVIKTGREGRKWGVRIALVSQYLEDYPELLLNAATSVFVMKGGNTSDEQILRNTFTVSEEAIRRLQRDCTGPKPEGANYLALFRTKAGFIVQILTNTVGPIELWAFSSTLEDVALRRRLYDRIGRYAARRLLAEKFPTGSAKRVIEKMKEESSEDEQISAVARLAENLIAEYQHNAASHGVTA